MITNKQFVGLSALILFLSLILFPSGRVLAQHGHHGTAMDGSKSESKKDHQMMCPMMGKGRGDGKMHGGMSDTMLMHGFHSWINRLMRHSDPLGLADDQVEKLDQLITTHLVKAVRDQADVQAQTITLRKDLRGESIDIKNVDKKLEGIHGKIREMQSDGISLYTQVLNVLTPEQREKMRDAIGTPFPPPWGKEGECMMCGDMQRKEDKSDSPKAAEHGGSHHQ